MNSAADALATIRARLAELESRAAARRERDAERNAEPMHAPGAPSKGGRRAAADEPAMQGRDWFSEAMEDLARVDAAPRVQTRRIQPATAPEYANESAPLCSTDGGHRTEPTTKVGGNADVPAVGQHEELRDGSPQPAAVPAASEASKSEGAKSPLSASGAATHGPRKMPQARAEHWSVRMKRIEATVMVCRLSQPAPLSTPYDLPTPVRDDPRPAAVAGCGPPRW